MAPHMFPTDEELGKRDDDYTPGNKSSQSWRNLPYNYRRRRVAIIIGAALSVWLLLHVISHTDPGYTIYDATNPPNLVRPNGPPPKVIDDTDEAARQHYYNGHIKFFELGDSLHKISNTGGLRDRNRNVLFAASSLKSVSALIPLACEMAKWNRNYVHFAIMGRYDIFLDDILEVNGVDREGCNIYWHDARPDFVTYSSDTRAEAVVTAALGHVHTFMHPQVVITDDSSREDVFFTKGVRRKTKIQHLPIIEIPQGRADDLEWLTRLDSSSLRAWHTPSIDILIHAPPKSSGSLLRLLQSIQDADYSGLTPPRITVELPPDIDPPSMWFLGHMAWPPSPKEPFVTPRQNGLILRHRIPDQKVSSDEAAVRFLESFYPSLGSHVLLLAPNAQLSPLYYHYLMFHLLEYRYSSSAAADNAHLIGLSLEVPSHHLNGTTAFEPPTAAAMRVGSDGEADADDKFAKAAARHPDAAVPFTWQAPNSNAALYFGDAWTEIHSFLTNRLRAFRLQADPVARPRTVHASLPSWLEYFLELMRARGHALLYPGLDGPAATTAQHGLVTVHTELYQPPEEMLAALAARRDEDDETSSSSSPRRDDDKDDAVSSPFLTADPAAALAPPPLHLEPSNLVERHLPLHHLLPFDADPPPLRALPALSHQGLLFAQEADVADAAAETARKFRRAIGGCGDSEFEGGGKKRVGLVVGVGGSARDLFCFGDGDDEGGFEGAVEGREAGGSVGYSDDGEEEAGGKGKGKESRTEGREGNVDKDEDAGVEREESRTVDVEEGERGRGGGEEEEAE
ncbi:glycosyltransferase 2 protein [Diplodia corticola]|uniref:Glycosyltransferase 2 protein n=1 Tax=Diplodia corticola TaxID=236234 RepID=A0A1J9S5F9_9PEZI|nr:glycosyltransferase 2 protein [Diplodia corticola]OJD40195.1 glycosyltransferase 2 protein [Diplodia corticola]